MSFANKFPPEIVEYWTPVYEKAYQKGDWVIATCHINHVDVEYIGQFDRNAGTFQYLFNWLVFKPESKNIEDVYDSGSFQEIKRCANEDEIKWATNNILLKEAKEKFPIGYKFVPAHCKHPKKECCIVVSDKFAIVSQHGGDNVIIALTTSGGQCSSNREHGNTVLDRVVYIDGVWAKEYSSIPEITINGHKGEFFPSFVRFGCATIDKQDFIDLNKIATKSNITNKKLRFVTIGDGVFSREQIKEIANYYLN